MHRWTREAVARDPSRMLPRNGAVLSDPRALLDSEAARCSSFWNATRQPPTAAPIDVHEPWPVASLGRIRSASKSYPLRSATS
eukprot:4710375-Pyramimonas_sp.AAC.1